MGRYFHKSHNVNLLLYHYVCPAKYRRIIFGSEVDEVLVQTCREISERYDFEVLEIGTDGDHVHFLIQGTPALAPKTIVQILKSITARRIYRLCPYVKRKLWGGELWSDGYFVSTVGEHGNEAQIRKYVQSQGKEYHRIYRKQAELFNF